MTRTQEYETVLRVACLTEDRSSDEQRAMLAMALMLDGDFATYRPGKQEPRYPELTRLVEETYAPEGRRVNLTAQQREALAAMEHRFDECSDCGVVMYRHAIQCLDRDRAAKAAS